MKDVVWSIEVYFGENGSQQVSDGTGVSVSNYGLIMTCDHLLPSEDKEIEIINIRARRHDENVFRDVSVKRRHSTWDVAILELNSRISCNSGQFASDGSLYAGQPLAHLGNPVCFPNTFLVGRASFPCVDDVIMPTSNQTCSTYKSDTSTKPPRYYIIGHRLNCKTPNLTPFDLNLHPMVPVVVCASLNDNEGCSGGPVFKSDGTIIGLICRPELAIHVSVLKHCLKEFEASNVGTSQHS